MACSIVSNMFQTALQPHTAGRRPNGRKTRAASRRRGPLFIEPLETRALPSFLAPLNYDTGSVPNSVAVGDFNGDGIPDLVTTSLSSVSVLLGNGDGTFQPPRNMAAAGNPAAVVVGDFNGDGIPDLAVANVGDNSVSVLLGNGDGSFRLAGTFGVGRNPDAIAVGDFNGDGIDDLVTANRGSNTVSVLLGNGDGSFQPARDSGTGSVPVAVAVADFNGDGIPDLVVADFGTGRFDPNAGTLVLLGNGDGTFQPPTRNLFNDQTSSVVVADFNGDGIPDFAVTLPNPGNAVVALGNGDGTFRFLSFPTHDKPNRVAVGDFNGDHVPDLVVAAPHVLIGEPDHGSVYLGNGDGTFQAAGSFVVGGSPLAMAVGDFNGDRSDDLAVAARGGVGVLLGNGDGTFPSTPDFALRGSPDSVAVGDFNGDGIADLVTANIQGPSVSLLLGHGDGTFQPARTVSAGGAAVSVQVADFNGDGNLDLVVANTVNRTVSIVLGNGDGTFQAPRTFAVRGQPSAIAVADFIGDGIADLAVTYAAGTGVDVFLGNGDGTFQAPTTYSVVGAVGALAARDLNGDGIPDLVVATNPSQATGTVSVLLGNGDGSFQPARTFAAGGFPTAVALGDFTGDGIPDLAVANTPQSGLETVSVLLGNGDGTFQAPLTFPAGLAPTDFGTAPTFSSTLIAVGDFNQDGVDDLAVVSGAGIRLVLGNRAAHFQTFPFLYNTGGGSHSVAVWDFNSDGFPDFAVANTSTLSAFILLNDTVWPSGGSDSRSLHAPTGRARAVATGPTRPAPRAHAGPPALPLGLAPTADHVPESPLADTLAPGARPVVSAALPSIPELRPLANRPQTPLGSAAVRLRRAQDLLFTDPGWEFPSLAIEAATTGARKRVYGYPARFMVLGWVPA